MSGCFLSSYTCAAIFSHSFGYLFQLLFVVPLSALLGMPPLLFLLPLNKLFLGMPPPITYLPYDTTFRTPLDTSAISVRSIGATFLLPYLR
ncbi:hypothetical protein KY290_021588 [Solanum tuberosum]|uniref:Uncharacterized protein n=1 Tax=Solanum tuberosum TaxID=4113 RepID=A0ABQ7V547_SOLTU|nr:hypothetical protein KY289_020748 [Solanum tuberosum]KAH0758095.1 hypothetical protein KY290_021588 [Solanum tuberosum]